MTRKSEINWPVLLLWAGGGFFFSLVGFGSIASIIISSLGMGHLSKFILIPVVIITTIITAIIGYKKAKQ